MAFPVSLFIIQNGLADPSNPKPDLSGLAIESLVKNKQQEKKQVSIPEPGNWRIVLKQ